MRSLESYFSMGECVSETDQSKKEPRKNNHCNKGDTFTFLWYSAKR